MIYLISYSGGKDSTALWSWARRTKLWPRHIVACDTGWEWKGWRAYVDLVSTTFGESVEIVGDPRGFEGITRYKRTFPGKVNTRRWCTESLKLEPFKAVVDRLRDVDDVTVVVGVRAEESADRAKMPEREWSDFYDCQVWRPLLAWTLEDVAREHHLAGVPFNPLYHLGAERVGCWPCVKSGKREIRLVSEIDPERIDRIRAIEQDTGNTMFCLEASRAGGAERRMLPTGIDEVVAWSKTKRGGKRLAVVQEPGGCARWGLCEAAPKEPA